MLSKIKNIISKSSKKSNTALYIIVGIMFLVAFIYMITGIIGILN